MSRIAGTIGSRNEPNAAIEYVRPFALTYGAIRLTQARSGTGNGLNQAQLDRTSAAMDRAIPDALVTGYEPLCAGLNLPDPDDRHVLAAAIKCNASVIVTFNLKDFPPEVLEPFEIEAVHPDDFIADLFDLDQAAVLEAAQAQRASLKNPPHTARELLDRLLVQGLTQSVKLLSEYERLI
nr:PIN domain-containing protein [Pseudomonas aeruginosa]